MARGTSHSEQECEMCFRLLVQDDTTIRVYGHPISSFPRARKTAAKSNNNEKHLTIQIHCTCQLPEYGEMVQCDLCDIWYHLTCINLGQAPDEDEEWLCESCAPLC